MQKNTLLFFVFRFLCDCAPWFAMLAAVPSRMYLTMGLGDFNYMDHPVSLPAKHLLHSDKIRQRWPESGEDQLGTRPKSKVTFHCWGGCTAFSWECCRCCKFFLISVCASMVGWASFRQLTEIAFWIKNMEKDLPQLRSQCKGCEAALLRHGGARASYLHSLQGLFEGQRMQREEWQTSRENVGRRRFWCVCLPLTGEIWLLLVWFHQFWCASTQCHLFQKPRINHIQIDQLRRIAV